MSEQQFVTIMLARMRRTDVLEDVRRLFKALDVRAQGFLSLQSFQSVRRRRRIYAAHSCKQRAAPLLTDPIPPAQVCSSALPHLPPRTVLSAFHEADRDGDGRVSGPVASCLVCKAFGSVWGADRALVVLLRGDDAGDVPGLRAHVSARG